MADRPQSLLPPLPGITRAEATLIVLYSDLMSHIIGGAMMKANELLRAVVDHVQPFVYDPDPAKREEAKGVVEDGKAMLAVGEALAAFKEILSRRAGVDAKEKDDEQFEALKASMRKDGKDPDEVLHDVMVGGGHGPSSGADERMQEQIAEIIGLLNGKIPADFIKKSGPKPRPGGVVDPRPPGSTHTFGDDWKIQRPRSSTPTQPDNPASNDSWSN